MRSLIMSDVETGTEWSHILGRGMKGKYKGHQLKVILTDMVTWDVWKQEFPETTVLNMSRTSKNYTREFYRRPHEFVFGFDLDGQAWALPLDQLLKHDVHSFQIGKHSLLATFDKKGTVTHLFDRKHGEQVLDFEKVAEGTMRDQQSDSHWKILTGEAISGPMKGQLLNQRVGIMSFRRAWQNFHPASMDVSFD